MNKMAYTIKLKNPKKDVYRIDANNEEQALHFFKEQDLIVSHENKKYSESRITYQIYDNKKPLMNFETKKDAEAFVEERTKLPKHSPFALNKDEVEIRKKESVSYKLGERWRGDFDYSGMVKKGSEAESSWGLKDLNKLFDSYEDVNYHKESEPLYEAIQELEKGNKEKADIKLAEFRKINKETLKSWGE